MQAAQNALKVAYSLFEELDFVGACEAVMNISYETNAYIDRAVPWSKFKSENELEVALAGKYVAITSLGCCRP